MQTATEKISQNKLDPFKLVVLISGSGSNLQAIIDAIDEKILDAELCLVLSNNSDAYGLKRAQKSNISTAYINHKDFNDRLSFDQAMIKTIDSHQPDLVVLAGFMRILSDEFVQHYMHKMINIHPSLLPKYKGLHTHKRALESGDTEHGLTIHYVNNELDSGPIIKQVRVNVLANDTEQSLSKRVLQEEHKAYPQVIQELVLKKKKVLSL